MRCRIAIALLVLFGTWAAPAGSPAWAEEETSPAELTFFRAYYVQHAEGRPQQALLLYLDFLEKAPDSPYAMNAARYAFELLQGEESEEHRAKFLEAYGHLLPREAPTPPTPAPAPAPPEAPVAQPPSGDVLLLKDYEAALAAGRSIPDVAWATTMRTRLARLWREGAFMEATRVASQVHRILAVHRVAEMLQRKEQETEALRRQVEIDVSLAGAEADPDVLARIEDQEKALALARTEAGLAEQIARLYPDAWTSPGPHGLLPLTMGLALPDDPRFTAWLRRQKLWLADQSRRATASPKAVEDAIALGRILTSIDDLLHDGEWTRASNLARELWKEASRRP